jgi:cation:H+ antiporter
MNPLIYNVLIFVAGFVLLTGGAEFLVRGASRLALRLNISPVVIGLTVVAFGTSLPELLVSLIANLQGGSAAELAIGNVVGSNIANLALILGIVAILNNVPVERQLMKREYPLMLIVSLVLIYFSIDGQISQAEGLILIGGLLGFTYFSYTLSRGLPPEEQLEAIEFVEASYDGHAVASPTTTFWNTGLVVVGMVGLVSGANWLVDSAQFIARYFGVSELVIGLSLVAIGTSLPELATSVVAILRKEGDIAVGNLVGSNLFNILAIVGITSTVRPLPVPGHMLWGDFPIMLLVAILPLMLVIPRPHLMTRWKGAMMLLLYFGYTFWLFSNGYIQPVG